MTVLLLHLDALGKRRFQFALGPLNGNRVAFKLDRHTLGNNDRLFSNS